MRVLITSAASRLAQELATALSASREVRLTDRKDVSLGVLDEKFVRCDLDYGDATKALVRGADAIIHSGEVDPAASVSDQLDAAMRCTYSLLWAAWEEGVPRLIFLSSLSILDRYDQELAVTERWRPLPGVNPPTLCYHLAEFVCREFAREGKIDVVCLRLGDLVLAPGEVSASALYIEDAVQAVEKALTADPGAGRVGRRNAGPAAPRSPWNIFHIQSDVPRARYLTTAAQEALGFLPTRRS